MNPGGGAWHSSTFKGAIQCLRAFQFRFASPPGIKDGLSSSVFLDVSKVPRDPNFKLLMGEYEGLKNPLPSHVNVLDVPLAQPGDEFTYFFPQGHELASLWFTKEALLLQTTRRNQHLPTYSCSTNMAILWTSRRRRRTRRLLLDLRSLTTILFHKECTRSTPTWNR